MTLAEGLVDEQVHAHCGSDVDPEEWDLGGLKQAVGELLGLESERLAMIDLDGKSPDELRAALWLEGRTKYEDKAATIEQEILRRVERDIMLQVVDVSGRTTCIASITSKKGSASGGTASETRSSSTSAKASRCSRQ